MDTVPSIAPSGGLKKDLCLDATANPVQMQDPFGRRINHSKRRPNVKPRLADLPFPEGEKTVMLFYAQRDIEAGVPAKRVPREPEHLKKVPGQNIVLE